MDSGTSPTRRTKRIRGTRSGASAASRGPRKQASRANAQTDEALGSQDASGRADSVAAHPLAELLQCPPATGSLLNASAQFLNYDAGESVFHQSDQCQGLYLVVSGTFLRKAERLQSRLTLGTARPGDLLELAAALGDGEHTYSLTAQSLGSILMLPIDALNEAFRSYPPLRMQLLEELAREVSRAYCACRVSRALKSRRRNSTDLVDSLVD